MTDQTEH